MSEMSEKARAASKEKAKRLTGERKEAVDASDYGEAPCGFMHTDQKLGNRPISKQNLATGGRAALKHGGRKSRMVGGASTAGAPFVAQVAAPPQNRFSFTGQPSPFLGAAGLKRGGKAKHRDEGGVVNDHDADDMNRGGRSRRYKKADGGVSEDLPNYVLSQDKDSQPWSRAHHIFQTGRGPSTTHDANYDYINRKRQEENRGGRSHRKEGGGNWIAGAIKHPGALHKELGVPEGKKIPAKKLKKAEHSSNPLERKRANLAETLKSLHKAKGGSVEGQNPEIIGNRPVGGRNPRKDGGRTGKGKMNVNIIIAQKPDHPAMPMGGAPMPPPRPPMPMAPPPGAMPPPGAGPQGMPAGPMPGGPNMPPPSMARPMGHAKGGKVYPIKDGSGSGEGRLEKIKAYGGK